MFIAWRWMGCTFVYIAVILIREVATVILAVADLVLRYTDLVITLELVHITVFGFCCCTITNCAVGLVRVIPAVISVIAEPNRRNAFAVHAGELCIKAATRGGFITTINTISVAITIIFPWKALELILINQWTHKLPGSALLFLAALWRILITGALPTVVVTITHPT